MDLLFVYIILLLLCSSSNAFESGRKSITPADLSDRFFILDFICCCFSNFNARAGPSRKFFLENNVQFHFFFARVKTAAHLFQRGCGKHSSNYNGNTQTTIFLLLLHYNMIPLVNYLCFNLYNNVPSSPVQTILIEVCMICVVPICVWCHFNFNF